MTWNGHIRSKDLTSCWTSDFKENCHRELLWQSIRWCWLPIKMKWKIGPCGFRARLTNLSWRYLFSENMIQEKWFLGWKYPGCGPDPSWGKNLSNSGYLRTRRIPCPAMGLKACAWVRATRGRIIPNTETPRWATPSKIQTSYQNIIIDALLIFWVRIWSRPTAIREVLGICRRVLDLQEGKLSFSKFNFFLNKFPRPVWMNWKESILAFDSGWNEFQKVLL